MKVKFWGVRGSLPSPGPTTIKYGGNTSCIQIITDLDYQLIIDCGTGIRELGNYLIQNHTADTPMEIYIFITHVHWDHIMGFPFFKPIYLKNAKIHIFGPKITDFTTEQAVGEMMSFPHFPVDYRNLPASIDFNDISPGNMTLPGNLKISYDYLNHPVPTLGYRIDYKGKSVGTCYDHEPFDNMISSFNYENLKNVTPQELTKRLVNLYSNVDLLIHDTQYTSKEYETNFIGWGHSSYDVALVKAVMTKAKQLSFFHHDLSRTDEMLNKVDEFYYKVGKQHNVEAHPAIEGSEIDL